MSEWKNKIRQFYNTLNQKEGLHSVKDLCRSFLEGPYASFWKDQEAEKVIKYIGDWLDASQYKFEFHNKWIEMPNMNTIASYDEQEINKAKELLGLLKHN